MRGDHSLDPSLYDAEQSLRDAAVLVPIVERDAGLTVLLTRRTDHLHHHAGPDPQQEHDQQHQREDH